MRLLLQPLFGLLATTTTTTPSSSSSSRRTTWFIDGNNLMGHKGTPRDRQSIADKLQPIQDASSDLAVVLVWDGRRGQEETLYETPEKKSTTTTRSVFQVVSLAEGLNTDDYILEQLQSMMQAKDSNQQHAKVQVVTADRALRRRVLQTKPIVKGVVNPVVFWRRYRPRLTGLKSDYQNTPKHSEDEDDAEL